MADWFTQNRREDDPGGGDGTVNPPDPNDVLKARIADAYRKYLGRDPQENEYQYWVGNGNFEAEIAASPEAKAYAAKQGGGGGGNGAPPTGKTGDLAKVMQWLDDNSAKYHLHDAYKLSNAVLSMLESGQTPDQIIAGYTKQYEHANETNPGSGGKPGPPTGGGGPGPGGNGGPNPLDPNILAPWTETFNGPQWTGGDFSYAPWDRHFQAPTTVDEQNDPGFKARMEAGTKALQNSAAARGTLLTGGTAKALDQFGQDYGSNEYEKVFGRAMTNYQSDLNDYTGNYSRAFGEYQNKYAQYTDSYNRARSEYDLRESNFFANEDRPFSKLFSLTQLGANSAGNLNNTNQQYGTQYQNWLQNYLNTLYGAAK